MFRFPKDVASFSCTKSSEKNTMHGSTFLQCCECCGMGRLAASKNATCQPAISLNKTCDDIYQRCCKKAKGRITSIKFIVNGFHIKIDNIIYGILSFRHAEMF